jgi:hypothetical protein
MSTKHCGEEFKIEVVKQLTERRTLWQGYLLG